MDNRCPPHSDLMPVDVQVLNSHSERVESLVALFETIAREEGWLPGSALREHLENSIYIAASLEEELLGGIQQVISGEKGSWWPSRTIWPECDPGLAHGVAHVLVLALQKSSRGTPDLFLRLCIELWQYCLENQIRELRLECTPQTYRIYNRIGMPLEVIGESRVHWGEPCIPVSLDVEKIAIASHNKASRQSSFRSLLNTPIPASS